MELIKIYLNQNGATHIGLVANHRKRLTIYLIPCNKAEQFFTDTPKDKRYRVKITTGAIKDAMKIADEIMDIAPYSDYETFKAAFKVIHPKHNNGQIIESYLASKGYTMTTKLNWRQGGDMIHNRKIIQLKANDASVEYKSIINLMDK